MSYRSDVRIVVSKKGYKELESFSNEHLEEKENFSKDSNLLYSTDIKHEDDNAVYMGWNDIKWYEYSDYHYINAIMEGLQHLKDNDLSFRYARIGESVDDMEENYYESENEEEQDLEYPSFRRDFDDDYTIANMNVVEKENSEKELQIKLLGYDDFDYATYIDKNGRYYKNISFENETADLYYGSFNDYDCEPSSRVPDNIKIVVVKDFEKEVEL